jgi:hypothetical protein
VNETEEDVFKAAAEKTKVSLSPLDEEAIRALADELDAPLSRVAEVYGRELARLASKARVTTFLPLVVSRLVRRSRAREQSKGWVAPAAPTGLDRASAA